MKFSRLKPMTAISVLASLGILLAGCGASSGSSESTSASDADSKLSSLVPKAIEEKGEITIATILDNPPHVSVDDKGEVDGLMHDLTDKAAEKLGLKTKWENIAFSGIIPGLQSGKFDASTGSIADSKERQQVVTFVDIFKHDDVFLVRKGNPKNSADLNHACGHTIGLLAGSTQIPKVDEMSQECTASGKKKITSKIYQSPTEAMTQVGSGVIDAYFGPYLVLKHTAEVAGEGKTYQIGDTLYDEKLPWAIAFDKSNGDLAKAFQKAITELVKDGTYKKIADKYDASSEMLNTKQIIIDGSKS